MEFSNSFQILKFTLGTGGGGRRNLGDHMVFKITERRKAC